MRVAVTSAPRDRGYRGWLRADLERRLGRDAMAKWVTADDDVLVAVIGIERDEAATTAAQTGHRVIPVVLDGAAIPQELGDADPVRASDDYWDAMLDVLVERIGVEPKRRRSPLAKIPRPRLAVGAAIGAVASVFAILTSLGVFDTKPAESGGVALDALPANNLTQQEYRDSFTPAKGVAEVPVAADAPGYVFSPVVTLENPDGDRFGVHWTLLNATDHKPLLEHRNFAAVEFGPDRANGLHPLWVPCPKTDALNYVAEFSLVNESHPERPRLGHVISDTATCRITTE